MTVSYLDVDAARSTYPPLCELRRGNGTHPLAGETKACSDLAEFLVGELAVCESCLGPAVSYALVAAETGNIADDTANSSEVWACWAWCATERRWRTIEEGRQADMEQAAARRQENARNYVVTVTFVAAPLHDPPQPVPNNSGFDLQTVRRQLGLPAFGK